MRTVTNARGSMFLVTFCFWITVQEHSIKWCAKEYKKRIILQFKQQGRKQMNYSHYINQIKGNTDRSKQLRVFTWLHWVQHTVHHRNMCPSLPPSLGVRHGPHKGCRIWRSASAGGNTPQSSVWQLPIAHLMDLSSHWLVIGITFKVILQESAVLNSAGRG